LGLILFIIISFSITYANDINIIQLAKDRTWLKLLHYDNDLRQSEILDNSFFISPVGRTTPEKELEALIESYQSPWTNEPDSHPRCRFPARYYWLSKKIKLPNYEMVPLKCKKLNQWSLHNKINSISLLLVSGYLGNPASTFGHTLLKLNSSDKKDDLFDLSINYGALIPENESTWKYILKGLSGGYVAGYSDRYFYNQDMTYIHTEFRDIWNYHLNFTKDEKNLLILHLWEIAGKKTKYYFLTRNCAFEIGKLLEVVIKKPLTDNAHMWYAPIELFNRIEDINTQKILHDKKPLIQTIRYIPSSQRFLVAQYNLLDKKSKKIAKQILQKKDLNINLKKILSGKSNSEKYKLLDFLLAYQQYRYIKEQPNPTLQTLLLKNKILLERLQLPPSKPSNYKIKQLLSPAKGEKPFVFSIGMEHRGYLDNYMTFNTIFFAQESTGQNSLDDNELTVFDISFGVNKNIFLNQIDYIRILKLSTNNIPVDRIEQLSWNLILSTVKEANKDKLGKYDHSILFGVGKAIKFLNGKGFAMLDLSAHTLHPHTVFKPKLGSILKINRKSKLYFSYGLESYKKTIYFKQTIDIKYQYSFSPYFSFLFKYHYKNNHNLDIQLRIHW